MALRILLVDNEPATLEVVKELTESLGYEVVALESSLEAAQMINLQKFEAVFLSASTPYMDGFVLVRLIRCSMSNSTVPTIMLTGFGDAPTMRKAFEAGVTFFLSKPLDPQKLRAFLNCIRGQMLKEKRSYARLPVRTIVNCRAENKQFRSLSVNVSQRGMLLVPSGGMDVGQQTDLRFNLPDIAEPLNPRATVVRKDPDDCMAVRFTELGARDHQALGDYIAGMVKG